MISVVLSNPELDKRTTWDRRIRQTDGGGGVGGRGRGVVSKAALTKFIPLEQFESVPTVS